MSISPASGSTGNPHGRGNSGRNWTGASHANGQGRGNGTSHGNGQQGRGGNGNNSPGQSGSSGNCTSVCHVTQQPAQTSTPTVTPAPAPVAAAVAPPVATAPSPAANPVRDVHAKHSSSTRSRTTATRRPSRARRPKGVQSANGPRHATSASPQRGVTTAATVSPPFTGLLGSLPLHSTSASTNAFTHPTAADPTRRATAPVGFVSPILHFVAVVPLSIWLALGGSLALAAVAAAVALRSSVRARRQAGRFAALNEAATTDALTGILNRRGFVAAAERELARSRRYERPFVLAYVDVRGLKAVNDSEGHRAGDKLIQTAAGLLADCARADDVVGRLGGDEMALILAEQGPEGAAAATERIAAEVAVRRAELGLESRWDLTVGTAAYPEDGETIDELLQVADTRLYEQRGIEIRDGVAAGLPAPR
jgi:diguanylate cyclase (GGDEF)-like protein